MSDLIAYLAERSVRAPVATSGGEARSAMGVQPRLPTVYEAGAMGEPGGADRRASEDETVPDGDRERVPPASRPSSADVRPERPMPAPAPGTRVTERVHELIRVAEPEAGRDAAAQRRPSIAENASPPPAVDQSQRRETDAERSEASRPPPAAERPARQMTDAQRALARDETPPVNDADERSPLTTPISLSTLAMTTREPREEEDGIAPVKPTARFGPSRSPDAPAAEPSSRGVVIATSAPVSPAAGRPNASPPAAPVSIPPRVQITIGRIEIRATQARAPQPPQRREFGMSLEEYLAKRERG